MTTTPTLWRAAERANTTDEPEPGAHPDSTNTQANSRTIGLESGRYLVLWEDSSGKFAFGLEPRDIVGQIYNHMGEKVGGEIVLSGIYSDLDQKMPDVTALKGGGFAVAYQTSDATGIGDGENVIVEVFGSDGLLVRNEDFRQFDANGINDLTPALASFADGSYVVAFADDSAGNTNINAYVVSKTGVKGAAIAIESAAGSSSVPDVDVLKDGNFAVVYEQASQAGNIRLAIRTAAGGVVADANVAANASAETAPQVAALSGGGFVVVWSDAAGDGAGDTGIKARIYSNAGSAAGAAFSVNTAAAGVQDGATVTALKDGGFMVAWRDAATGTVEGARFAANGAPVGSQVTLADIDTAGDPSLSLLEDGRVALSVTNVNGSANSDVYQAIWDPRSSPITGSKGGNLLTSRTDGALLEGKAGDDRLFGLEGADTLNGGAGADIMRGGGGNDTYYVTESGDVTNETVLGVGGNSDAGGTDTVYSLVDRTLGIHIEILRLQGSGGLAGTGNTLANKLYGNAGDNLLSGLDGADVIGGSSGDDTLDGGSGDDTLTGSAGKDVLAGGTGNDRLQGGAAADTFRFSTAGQGADRILDFDTALDRFDLDGAAFTGLSLAGSATILTYGGGTIRIDGVNNLTLAQWNALVLPAGGEASAPGGIGGHDGLVGGAGGLADMPLTLLGPFGYLFA